MSMMEVGLMFLYDEVLLNIFLKMDNVQSIINLGATCTRLANISRDETIWQRRLREDFPLAVKYVNCLASCFIEPSTGSGPNTGGPSIGAGAIAGGSSIGGPKSTGLSIGGVNFDAFSIKGCAKAGEDEDSENFTTWRAALRSEIIYKKKCVEKGYQCSWNDAVDGKGLRLTWREFFKEEAYFADLLLSDSDDEGSRTDDQCLQCGNFSSDDMREYPCPCARCECCPPCSDFSA